MRLIPRARRGRVAAGLSLVLVLVVAVLVAVSRPEATWSVEVDGAGRVRDWDDDRLLLGSPGSEVLLLDRSDGDVLSRYDVSADAAVEQVSLVPGGYLVQWTSRSAGDATTVLARITDDGTEVWRREEATLLRVLGVLVEDGVVAVATPSTTAVGPRETVSGLDLDDGSVRWERGVRDHARVLDDGRTLRSVGVVLVDPDGEDTDAQVVDLADGETLGAMDVEVGAPTSAVYWRDVVLVADGERWQRTVAGVEAPIDGLEEADGLEASGLLTPVGDGVVQADLGDATWGVDLEAGTVVRLPLATAYVEQASAVRGQVDGDELLLVAVASGEETRTEVGGGSGVVAHGADAVLLRESLGRLAAWRHLLGPEDASRLTVVDRSGEQYGDLPLDRDDLAAATVLDGHEAVVVLTDGDARRVVLLGR